MKRQYIWMGLFALMLCGIVSCGVWMGRRPAAPMAKTRGQVTASLTALPEALSEGKLLCAAGNPLVLLEKSGGVCVYEVMRSDYRKWTMPVEGASAPKLITPAPDGGYWMVMEETSLVKVSAQGTLLLQLPLEWADASDMACDSVGRVYIVGNGGTELLRYSPEGVLQGAMDLQTDFETVTLVTHQDRVFAAYFPVDQKGARRVEYTEITELDQLGARFRGCVHMAGETDVYHIGSFLPEYILMEYDDVGLYACREDGGWETVCLWEDLHLDGVVQGQLLCDAQGRGTLLYEKNGGKYVLTLFGAET